MQALIPFLVMLGLASGTHLNLLPYAYLASPLPVYHHSQNTRTGEHAYSYAGGPSAKEEVKDADGVMRGSYSYVDANGILQSVFYVADENGFRVAATNLPTDDDLPVETAQVLLATNAYSEEYGKSSRRKRSLEDSNQNSNQKQEEENKPKENLDQSQSESIQTAIYQVPDSILIPKLVATATSHQSQVQIHKNVQLEPLKSADVISIETEPLYQPVIAPQIPLATSHQSQVQIHNNLRLEVPEVQATVKDKPVDALHTPLAPIVPVPAIKAYQVENVAVALPSYHDNRIQLHKQLGLEGLEPKNAIKIKTEPVAVVQSHLTSLPVIPTVVAKEVLPVIQPAANLATASVTTSISSHGISQIHGDSKVKLATPVLREPALLLKTAPITHYQPILELPLYQTLPYATASHYRTQIHAN